MSEEKSTVSGLSDGNASKYDRIYPTGHLSPSSWDDSSEEQSDPDSSATDGLKKKNLTADSCAGFHAEDRRQSLARVRRRTRSGSSLVFDIANAKDGGSSEGCDESVSYSAKFDSQKCREVITPDLPPVRDSWNDWDSDEIISDIENYLCEKRVSSIRSKTSGSRSHKYFTVLEGKCTSQSDLLEDGVGFRSNANSKLSKIIEVEENRSNTSLISDETPRSAAPRCLQTTYEEYTARNASKDGVCNDSNVPIEYSQDRLENLTDENDSDDSDLWRKIRSRIRRKNSEFAMNYEDSQYVSSSLKFIFDEKMPGKISGDSCDYSEGKVKRNALKNGKLENGMCVDVREKTNGEVTRIGIADSFGRNLNDASSKETIEFGLENPFCNRDAVRESRSPETFAVDGKGRQDDVSTHVSGEEAFLTCNVPPSKIGSKRLRGNHTISISAQEKQYKGLHFNRAVNPIEDAYAEIGISGGRESAFTPGSPCSGSARKNWINNVSEKDVDRYSPTSFRRKILLDLDLSDTEEKCSTIERLIFYDSLDPRNPEVVKSSPMKNIADPFRQKTNGSHEAGKAKWKLGMRQSMEFQNRNACIRPCDYDNFGIGDSDWNPYDTQCRKINFPQDRGDIKYEEPDTKPGWGNLIMSLARSPVRREQAKESVFWIDLSEEKRDRPENPRDRVARQKGCLGRPEPSNSFQKKSFSPGRKANYKRINGKKRKRERVVTDENSPERECSEIGAESHNHWGERPFDRRRNWLVNTVTRRDALSRGKQWIQTLILTRKKGRSGGYRQRWRSGTQPISNVSNKSTDCFSNLLKQFVNIFTVSRKSKK